MMVGQAGGHLNTDTDTDEPDAAPCWHREPRMFREPWRPSELIERQRTVTSLEPGAAPKPEKNAPIDTRTKSQATGRRTVRLAALADVDAGGTGRPPAETRAYAPRHARAHAHALPTSRDDWLVLAERVVGDWAATLRAALLLGLAVAAVIMVIGLVLGAGAALATAFLALLVFVAGRRRRR